MPLIPPAAKIPLPIQESLRDFFVDLLGKGAAAEKAKELKVKTGAEAPKLLVSVWEDKYQRVGALCISELMLAAIAGSALVLAPASTLPEVEKAGELPDNLRENYQEVVNILTSVLNTPSTPHLKLTQTYAHPGDELPQAVWDVIAQPSQRRDFDLTVEGYGSGKISILTR
ncbi:MAG: hypothetical protein AB7V43_05380 [Acidimicrobiia bacterium]